MSPVVDAGEEEEEERGAQQQHPGPVMSSPFKAGLPGSATALRRAPSGLAARHSDGRELLAAQVSACCRIIWALTGLFVQKP